MTETSDEGLPPSLRFLKLLVIVLMITMIGGVIAVVTLLVTRLPDAAAPPALPASLILPEGARAQAVTFGKGWIAIVTEDGRLLLYPATGGAPQREIALELPPGG